MVLLLGLKFNAESFLKKFVLLNSETKVSEQGLFVLETGFKNLITLRSLSLDIR